MKKILIQLRFFSNISKLTPGVYLVVFKEDNTAKVITNKLIIN